MGCCIAGVPAITIPIRLSNSGLPIGLQIISNCLQEQTMLNVAKYVEHKVDFPYLHLDA